MSSHSGRLGGLAGLWGEGGNTEEEKARELSSTFLQTKAKDDLAVEVGAGHRKDFQWLKGKGSIWGRDMSQRTILLHREPGKQGDGAPRLTEGAMVMRASTHQFNV